MGGTILRSIHVTLTLALITALSAPAMAESWNGDILVGARGYKVESDDATTPAGFGGVSADTITFNEDFAGRAFTLVGTDATGEINVDITFYDADGVKIRGFETTFGEQGKVPVGSASAIIVAWSGIAVTYTLDIATA